MTRSHAKNNTSGSVFTYHERHRLDYGTKKQRIGADSMKKLDSCGLCLSKAVDPVACSKGHLYCKECILSNLLSQKSQIRSQQAALDAHAASELAEKEKARSEARARVLSDFEKGLTLGAGSRKTSTDGRNVEDRGTKRKFEFDQDMIEKLAKEAEEAAMQAIEQEQAEARRAKLPAFWLPTLTPQARVGPLKDIKLQTLCSADDETHPLAMKNLLPVKFTYATSSTRPADDSRPICPSCSKELSNASECCLLTSRAEVAGAPPPSDDAPPSAKRSKKDKSAGVATCGHVVCGTCVETIVKPGKQCVVCEANIRTEKDIVNLAKEGTGFAAAGGAEAKKDFGAFKV